MNICKREFESKRIERKADELCRDQQLVRLRCTAADVISETQDELASVQQPEDLAAIVERFRVNRPERAADHARIWEIVRDEEETRESDDA